MRETLRVPHEKDVPRVVRPRVFYDVYQETLVYEQAGMHVSGRFDIYEKVVG